MPKNLKIVIAQLNLTVGDIQGNLAKHIDAATQAREKLHADIIIFPELSLTGYPPEDLLLRPAFLHESTQAMETFMANVRDIHCLISYPHQTNEGLFNCASLVYNGRILVRHAKIHLPNYGVFDEDRYFIPGTSTSVVPVNGVPVGVVICEDLWFPEPTRDAVMQGARIILSPNASPFETDKHAQRVNVLKKRAQENQLPIVFVNGVGGQDELIFDGGSMVADEKGNIAQFAGFFKECLLPIEAQFTSTQTTIATTAFELPSKLETIYQALVLAVRDYVQKNNFKTVLIGVSGGIDSAITLAIAVDALGKDRVRAIIMPSRYTSDISLEDAVAVSKNLGVMHDIISIEPTYQTFLDELKPIFEDKSVDITEENIQARCRSIILMAIANKFNALVLTTGNRSEMAVGYCTLYGDMAGGFAVIKDVPKTLIYELAQYRNIKGAVIPERTITRAPTAELSPDQKDEDTLPPYSVLDQILERYLNQTQSANEIIAAGFNESTVRRVLTLVRQSQYKRRQSAVGPRINHKSFGRDWRYPITNGFKG